MDWLKLFTLLIAVASIQITAEGPKKKIRIHLPQNVKHIHHHKKIYITNHPASSQYAPAYMPSAEGAVAVPTNFALSPVASILPFNPVELYEESQKRLPSMSVTSSKLQPLYRSRGYYGPTHSEWEQQQNDLAPPPESTDHSYAPSAFSTNYPPKRLKIVKVNEPSRKKVVRKVKPKRVLVRGQPQQEEEHPVSTFHEQFYSDLDGSGTIKKIKKPQRVEKIIDGNAEHIHTYNEEHIHKLIYDDGSGKLNSVVGMDSAEAHPHAPFKNTQALLAFPSDALTGYTAIGSMGTPFHLEYAGYNPREVTHDHIFHDHGEIPPDVDVTKDSLSIPPRVTYNSHGLRIGGMSKGLKSKHTYKYPKTTKTTPLMGSSYYESVYNPYSRHRTGQKHTHSVPHYETSSEANIEDYRPIPSFKFKDDNNPKTRNVIPINYGDGKLVTDYRHPQTSEPSPFSVSSTVYHGYKPKNYGGHTSGPVSFTKYKDPLINFNDNSYSSNLDYDIYGSSSNVYASEYNYDSPVTFQGKKGKKKSISTQNISFGGLDHQTTVNHLEDSGVLAMSANDGSPTALEHFDDYDLPNSMDSSTSIPFTVRESSPVHPYYSAMAIKALHGGLPSAIEASNNNFQYAEAPTPSTTPYTSSVATTNSRSHYNDIQNTNPVTTEPSDYVSETGHRHKSRDKHSGAVGVHRDHKQRHPVLEIASKTKELRGVERAPHNESKFTYKHTAESPINTGNLKYGDKI